MVKFEMNYLEVGLPHSEFVPTRKEFSPRRRVPISGLSKRYLGLESMKPSELNYSVMRLSQPRKVKTQNEKNESNEKTSQNKSTRFTGKKKMSGTDIKSMIERLSRGRPESTTEVKKVQNEEEKNQRRISSNPSWHGNNITRQRNNSQYTFSEMMVK